jgi:hypothetical protein
MAIRIRKNGKILCAALNLPEIDDIYINDELHYQLSVIEKILVTEPWDKHKLNNGEWWWKNNVPENVEIDKFYIE